MLLGFYTSGALLRREREAAVGSARTLKLAHEQLKIQACSKTIDLGGSNASTEQMYLYVTVLIEDIRRVKT